MYSGKGVHFIMELIQNADDAIYGEQKDKELQILLRENSERESIVLFIFK